MRYRFRDRACADAAAIAANPELGVNAIAVMGKAIDVIGRLQAERRSSRNQDFAAIFPEAPYDVMNFGTITGGIAENIIAEQCTMRMTYRSLPDADPLALYHEIARRLARNRYARLWLARSHCGDRTRPAGDCAAAALASRYPARARALRCDRRQIAPAGAPFGTDGAWFARSGINTLICGPGEFAQAHQPNESIAQEAFERGPGNGYRRGRADVLPHRLSGTRADDRILIV